MNWTIYSGDDLIYNREIVDDDGNNPYFVYSPVLEETTSGFNSLTFTCTDDSPAALHVKSLWPLLEVYKDGNLYCKMRVLSDSPNAYGELEIYAEDFLGFLSDSVIRPYNFIGTPSEFLSMLIANHNSMVEEFQRFSAVVCDVPAQASTGNIKRSSEGYSSTWSVIQDSLLNSLGGHMWVSYDETKSAVLHYSLNERDTSTQSIELGKNLADLSIRNSATQFYTACLPLGAQDSETNEYLTIASENQGSDVLINTSAAAIYGVIFAPLEDTTWEDVTLASNLYTRGLNWLQNQSAQAVQEIEIGAVDLGDNDTESFFWLDKVPVSIPSRGINTTFIIKELSRQLDNPADVTLVLNYSGKPLTANSAASTAANARSIKEIKSDYVTNGEARAIADEQINQSTVIEQKANAIIMTALEEYTRTEDFTTFRSSVITQLSELAGRVEIGFTSTQSSVSTLADQTTATFSSIYSFIRFLAYIQGQQNEGVVIGLSTSDIKLKLEHDVLYFFTGDEKMVTTANAIAWFAANQLYVNNTTIQNLTLGTPGAYLDARIVGSGDNRCVLWSGRLS